MKEIVKMSEVKSNIHINEENEVVESAFKMDFPIEIIGAYYTVDAAYGDSPILKLECIDLEDNTDHIELWSIGKNWEITEKGDYIVPTKTQKGFNSQSTIGDIIKNLRDGKFGQDAYNTMLVRPLRRASSWIGTKWTLGGVEKDDLQNKDEHGKPKKKLKRLPVQWDGLADGSGTAGTTNAAAAPPVDLAAQLAAMQAQLAAAQTAQTPPATPPTPPPVESAAPVVDPGVAALQAQLAAAMAAASAPTPPPPTPPAPVAPDLVYFHKIDKSKLAGLVKAAKDNEAKGDMANNFFLVQAGQDYPELLTNPELAAGLMSGEFFKEMLFLAAGIK